MKRFTHVLSLAAILLFVTAVSGLCENGQAVYDRYKQTEKKMEKALVNIVMTLTMEGEGNITDTTIYIKGKKRRMEATVKKSSNPMMGKPGDKTIMIDDGVTSTIFSPQFGKMSSPSQAADDMDEPPQSVEYMGKESVEGLKCHKINVAGSYGEQETLWISVTGDALVKAESTNDGEKTVTVNSNFKEIHGFLLPQATKTYEDGALSGTATVTKIKTGAKLKDSLFDPEKVEGYENASAAPAAPQFSGQTQVMGQMMMMGMEIERLNREGKTEEAAALQKQLEAMAAGMGAQQ
ncbi:hypothetical protein DSLASN_31100 [Desulfoluna limicola]|uniref:DUF4412 domain-containing protein n=1 Tax=Desulfoluna limicola TaxID=2810562 RepID=A0ABM7PIT2_9BACT|nr:DUF4412 domain-containing protein [Desulfoluna limicola]BCS97478.1 hypothetical protein DSLASN_31100 [Desulfoluna limicola]